MRVLSLVTVFAAAVSGVFAAAVDVAGRGVSPIPEHSLGKRALATVYSNCTVGTKRVALTFDDGPYQFDTRLRTILANAGVKATFFINVKNWGCAYDRINSTRALYADGHMFANHGYAHRHYTSLSWDQMHDDLWRGELFLQRVLGVTPAFFRPPYGEYNTLTRNASGTRGQQMVLWNMDSGDSAGATVTESKNRYTAAAAGGRNILTLNHNTYNNTVEQVIPAAITTLKNAGYTFVTVAECLGLPAYQQVTAPGVPSSSWVCT